MSRKRLIVADLFCGAGGTSTGITQFCASHIGIELTPEDVEFGKAMERFKRLHGVRFPSWSDALFVAAQLGYRRVAEPENKPDRRTVREGDYQI